MWVWLICTRVNCQVFFPPRDRHKAGYSEQAILHDGDGNGLLTDDRCEETRRLRGTQDDERLLGGLGSLPDGEWDNNGAYGGRETLQRCNAVLRPG